MFHPGPDGPERGLQGPKVWQVSFFSPQPAAQSGFSGSFSPVPLLVRNKKPKTELMIVVEVMWTSVQGSVSTHPNREDKRSCNSRNVKKDLNITKTAERSVKTQKPSEVWVLQNQEQKV